MTYTTSTPRNAPKKYNIIETDALDQLSAILSPYSTTSNGQRSVCVLLPRRAPSLRLATPQARAKAARFDPWVLSFSFLKK